MIASVRGRVADLGADRVVVEVGGVGLEVQCSARTLVGLRVGDQAQLATALVVREDALTLFGFADADERAVFQTVQTVTGVGPRLAQALLATLTPDDLRRAVAAEDLATLTRVPGVGRKGAQRLVLELKDRLGGSTGAAPEPPGAPQAGAPAWRTAVEAGLVSLGWSTKEAAAAVDVVAAGPEGSAAAEGRADVGRLLKAALRTLDRA